MYSFIMASFCMWICFDLTCFDLTRFFSRICIDETGHVYIYEKEIESIWSKNQFSIKCKLLCNVILENFKLYEKKISMCGVLEFVTVNKNQKHWTKLKNSSRHCALYILTFGMNSSFINRKGPSSFFSLSLHLWWFQLPNSNWEVISIS